MVKHAVIGYFKDFKLTLEKAKKNHQNEATKASTPNCIQILVF